MTKSFKDALSRTNQPIPGVKDSRFPSAGRGSKPTGPKTVFSKPGGKSFAKSSSANGTGKQNPFNLKVSKPKFEVLNRTVSGSRGNAVVSRTKALAVRSATILPQLQEKNRAHVSSFIDRRFGVKDGNLSREEVMQERFAREQQRLAKKQSRKNKFNLNSIEDDVDADEDNDEFSLTHGGKSIEKMDDDELENYDQDYDQDEENESYNSRGKSGQLDRDLVSHGHFGSGGVLDDKKSKSDVMKELIAKSKFYKLERQKIKEENEQLCEDVNEAFAAIRGNLQVLRDEDRKKIREETVVDHMAVEDDYEATLKDLTFDPRSKPSDRTLTPEEREDKEKKRLDEQTKALLERMQGTEDADEAAGDEGKIDPELKRIAERQFKSMREFCHTGDEETYTKLVEYATKQPRTMIQLARAIRNDIGKLSASFTKRSNESGRGALMPTLGPIRLLLLVSRIFSCSDFHHVVATPAQLLLSYYLGVGRMTKLEHVQRALALVYCSTQFQLVGKRCVPEALQVLFTILRAACGPEGGSIEASSHYFCRPLGKSVVEELKNCRKSSKKSVDFSRLFDEKCQFEAEEIYSLTCRLIEEVFDILKEGNYPALKEAARPFSLLLPKNKKLADILDGSTKSLQLQQHKPLSLPLLTPDFAADYSMEHRKRSGQDADEQSAARMKRAMKREYKGAVRELKRDAAFLAEHKVKETRRKDSEYKAKMNKIIGSIGNGN